jgi:hypothetical protein
MFLLYTDNNLFEFVLTVKYRQCVYICITHNLANTQSHNGSHQGIGTGTGNVNNCPSVDLLSCPPMCVKLDNQGCVLCQCDG